MEMKVTAVLVFLAAALQGIVATPDAAADADRVRQLRVPRIYNALITTNEKLLPSRAYPHSAPVLQPLAPGFVQPIAVGPPPPPPGAEDGPDALTKEATPEGTADKKMQHPLTFYPRQIGYYPQPYLPYGYPSPYPYAYPSVYPYQAYPFQPYLQQPSPYGAAPVQQLPQNKFNTEQRAPVAPPTNDRATDDVQSDGDDDYSSEESEEQ